VNIFNRVLNFGIGSHWDYDKKRAYRQVNAFNAFLAIVASSAIPIAIIYKIYFGAIVQAAATVLYLSGYLLLPKLKLRKARLLAIASYEIHLFFVSFFAISPTRVGWMPYYSPIIICFMLYPLVAALFDMKVFKHLAIAYIQIIGIQLIGSFLFKINFPAFPEHNNEILNVIICLYTFGIGSILIYLLYSENIIVKNSEIKRAKKLEKLLKEVESQRLLIKEQASELQKINDTKNKFFSIIAHDLKSPYNAVLGLSQVLKDKSVHDPVYNKYAHSLHETALNTFNLLENLLEWSRAQLDHILFEPEPLYLNQIINHVIVLLESTMSRKKITTENQIDNNLIVHADKNLLHSIIRNLLTNAVKFSHPEGKIEVSCKLQTRQVEIAIKDYGIGMSNKMVHELFRIEKKLSRNGTSNEKGTGLGLFLCQEFIELHNGKIWIESIENKGTTCYFTIPLTKVVLN
jgi:signal transduction histidine kinase